MFSLSKSFENAHGFRLKTTFAETLTHLLHTIGKVCQVVGSFLAFCINPTTDCAT